MSFINIQLKIHLKYWYMYLLIFAMLIPSYVISLILGWFMANLGLNEIIAWVITIILGAEIMSLPLLFSNYKAACEIRSKKVLKLNLFALTLICHVPSLLLCSGIFLLIIKIS